MRNICRTLVWFVAFMFFSFSVAGVTARAAEGADNNNLQSFLEGYLQGRLWGWDYNNPPTRFSYAFASLSNGQRDVASCGGCGLELAAGLIPEATTAYESDYKMFRDDGALPPDAKLDPKPVVLIHPTPCTAILAYRRNQTMIHGAVIMTTYKSGSGGGVEDLYVALPESKRDLGKVCTTQ